MRSVTCIVIPQRYSGLGFVFSNEDDLAGIDLDDSLDEQGDVKPWARGIVERFADTYIEVSPSGKGLKIWTRGSLPANLPGVHVGDGAIELYDHSRYFAVTGRAFRGTHLEVEDIPATFCDCTTGSPPAKRVPLSATDWR